MRPVFNNFFLQFSTKIYVYKKLAMSHFNLKGQTYSFPLDCCSDCEKKAKKIREKNCWATKYLQWENSFVVKIGGRCKKKHLF